MRSYNEKSPSDRKIALLAVWIYAILLLMLVFFVKISSTVDPIENKPLPENGILIALDEMQDDVEESAPSKDTPPPPPPAKVEDMEDDILDEAEEAVIKKKVKKKKTPKVNKALLFSANKGKPVPQAKYDPNSKGEPVASSAGNKVGSKSRGRNFTLKGRSIKGTLPKPQYNSSSEGRVVISVYVNQEGKVTRATLEARTSTTTDAVLVKAALDAARKAVFNIDTEAAVLQAGTIEYIFIVR